MCNQTPSAQLTLPLGEPAPALARRFLAETICDAHMATVADEAELLVSELITNSVRHGAPPVSLRLSCDEGRALQVEVTDGSTVLPDARTAGPEDDSGRGVGLVDLLSEEWGVTPHPDGKTVWFTLGHS